MCVLFCKSPSHGKAKIVRLPTLARHRNIRFPGLCPRVEKAAARTKVEEELGFLFLISVCTPFALLRAHVSMTEKFGP